MALGAIISGIAAVGGAYLQNRSADRAADAASDAADAGIEFLRESRDIARADSAPYREAGQNALGAMNTLLGLPQVARASESGGVQDALGRPTQVGDDDIVLLAYRTVFGRNPDPGGYQF